MGAELSQLGHPPLPVLTELFAVAQFGATCLDDAVEDATKFCLVYAAVLFCRRWLVYNLPRPAQAVAAAAFVLLESHRVAGAFSDGAFAMLPGVDVALTFTARRALSAAEWRGAFVDGLRVRSLRDTYD